MTPSPPSSAIRWPDRYRPSVAPIHVRNERAIPAPREIVWAWLVRAREWPEWYPNSASVVLEEGGRDLGAGTRFRWRTFGAPLRSQVLEFEPPERLAWDARGPGVEAYHAWLLTPQGGGTHVLTEESQYGALARLARLLRPHRMEQGHDQWLRELARKAAGGLPS
jgi:uncharacterized protein YndB with AHSA1/START domain